MPFVQGTTDPTKGTVSQKGTKTNLAEEALASDRSELSQNSWEGFRQWLKDTWDTIAWWWQKAWTKLTSARDFDLDKAIELRETENYLAGIDYTKLTDEWKKEYDNVQNNLIKEWSTVAPYKIDIDKMNETVDNIINSNTYQKAKAVAEKNETEPTYKVDLSKKLKTAFYADVLNGADKKDRFFYNQENWWYTTYKPEETGMIVDEVYNALESRALWWAIDAIAETEDRIREGKPYNAKAYERAKEQYTDLKDFAIYAVNNSEKLEDFWDLVQAYKEETWKNPLVTTNEFWLNENSGTFYSRQFLREDLLDPNLNSWYKIASGIWYLFNAVWTVFDQWMAWWVWATNTVKDIFDDWILFNWNVAKDYELFDNMEFNSIYDSLAKNESWFSSARKIAYQVYDRIPDVLSMIWSSPKLFGRTDKILDTLMEQWVRDSAKKFAGTYEKTTEWLTKAIEWIEQLKKGWYVTQQVFKTILKDWILDNVVANAALKWNEYREYTPEDLLFDIWWSIVFDWLFMSLRLAKAGDILTKNKWLFKQELAKKHFWINDWDWNMMSNDDKLELGRFMDAIVDTTKMTDQMTVKRVEAMKKLVKQQYKDIDSAVDEIMKNAKYQWQKIIDFAANSKKWSNYVTKDANGNNVLKWSLSLDDTLTLRRDYIKDRWKKFDSYIKDKTYQWSRIASVKESIKEEWLTIDWIKKWWNKFKSLKEEAQKEFLSDMWLNMSTYDQHVFDVWKAKNKLKDATKPTELYAQLQTFKNVLSLHKRELRAQWLARTDWVLRNESALLTKSKTMAERWKDIVLKKMRRSRDPVYSAWHIRDWEDTKFLLTNQVKNNWEEFLAKIFDVIEWTVPPQELELWLYCDPIMRRQWNEFHFRADSIISDWTKWWWRYFNNPLEIAYFVWVEWKIKLPMPDWSERYLYYKMSWDNNPDWLTSSIKYDVIDPLNDDFYTSFLIKADWQITWTDWLSNYLVPYWDYWDENLVWIFENWMNKWDSDFSVFDIEDSDYKKLIDILSTTVDDMTMWTSNDVRQLLEKEIEEVKETQEFLTPNVDPKLTNTQETKEVATEVVWEVNKTVDLWEDSEVVTKEAKEEPISPKKKKELRAQRNALVWILKAVAWTKTNNPWFVDNWIIKKASMWWFIWNELYQDAIGKVPWLEELIDEPTYYRLQKLWNSRWYTTNDIQQSLTKMMNILLSKRYSVNAERWSFSVSFDWWMKKEWKQVYFSEPSWIDEMWEYAWDKWTAIWYSVDEKTSELKEKKDKEWVNYKTWGKTYKDIHILQYRKTKDWYRFESPISKTSDEKYMDIKIVDAYGGKKLRLTWYNKPKADKNYEESSWAPRWTLVFMKDVDPQKLEVDVKKQFNISNVDEVKAQLTFNGKIPLDTEIKDTSTIKDIIDHYSKKFWISISDPRTTLSEIQTNINEEYISDVFEALRDNISQEVSDDALTSYIVEWLEWSDINALINDWRARYWIDPSMIDATDPTEYIRMRIYDDYWLIDTKPNSLFENIWDRVWRRIVDVKISKWNWLSPVEMANLSNDEINRIIKQWIKSDNYIDILPEWDPLRTKLDWFWNKRLWFINRRIKSLRSQWIVYDNRREALKNNVIKHHKIKRSIQWELKEWWKLTKEQIQEYRNLWKQIIQESVELRWMWTNIVQQQRALINSPKLWRFVKSYVQWLWGNWNFKDLEEIFEYYNNIIDYDPYKIREEALDKIFDRLTNKWEAPAKKINTTIVKNSNDDRIRNTTKLRDNITVKVKDEPIVEWVTSDNSKAVEIKNDKAKEEIKANNDKIDLQDADPIPTADVDWWHLMWIVDDLKYEKWVNPFDKVKSFTIDKSAWKKDANWRLISWWDTWYKKYEDLFVKRADELWDSFYKKFLSANKNWKTLVSKAVDKIKNTRKDADIIRKEDNMELMYIDLMALKAWVPLPEPRLNMYLTRFELPRDCTVDQLAKRIADYHYKNYWWVTINWDWSKIRLNYNPTPSPLWAQDNILYNKAKSFWSIVVWLRSYFNEIKKVLPNQKNLKDKLYWDIADFFSKNFYEWDIAPIVKEKQHAIKDIKNKMWAAIDKYESLQKDLKKFAARKAKIKPESKTWKELWERYRINIAWEELEKEIDELWKEIEKYKQEWKRLEIRFKEWISNKELSQAINELSAWYDKANKQLQWTIEEKNKKLNWAMWEIAQEEDVDLWLWREHQEQELRNKDNTDYSKVRNLDTWLWKYSNLVPKANVDNWLWWGNLFKELIDDNEFDIKEAFEKLRKYQILEKQYRKKNKELANEIYWYLWWVSGKTISASRPFQNWAFSDPDHPAIVFSKDNWKLISKELPESLSRFMNSVILYHDLPKVKWFWETNTTILNSNIKEFFWWLTQSDIAKWEAQWWIEKFNDRLSKWPHKSRLFQKWAAIIDANTISNIEWEMFPVIGAQMEQYWKYWIMVQWTNIDNIKSLDKDLRDAWFVRVQSTWKDPFIFALQNEWYMYVPNEVSIKAAESRAKKRIKIDTSSVAETCDKALIEEAIAWISWIE